MKSLISDAVDSFSSAGATMFSSGERYGDDPTLDSLWDACSTGDWVSCDDLYTRAAFGSEYEQFGGSCGGTTTDDADGSCAGLHGMAETPSGDGANAYGDDPALDALWDSCAAGDMGSCDDLFFTSPIGSEYEMFGQTCGGARVVGTSNYCTEDWTAP